MKDMTSGTPIKQILLFSIPLIIGNIFQLFYNMVDTFIVGRTLGVNALAGIGAAGSVMFFSDIEYREHQHIVNPDNNLRQI